MSGARASPAAEEEAGTCVSASIVHHREVFRERLAPDRVAVDVRHQPHGPVYVALATLGYEGNELVRMLGGNGPSPSIRTPPSIGESYDNSAASSSTGDGFSPRTSSAMRGPCIRWQSM